MHAFFRRYLPSLLFVATYVALDRLSYIEPLFGLNITPWNPAPALGIVFWLHRGRSIAPFWFLALMLSEWVTRGLPEGWIVTIALSCWLVAGYGAMGTALRRFCNIALFNNRRDLLVWLGVIVVGSTFNSLGYLLFLDLTGLIPDGEWLSAFTKFLVGDLVGLIVAMPIIWTLSSQEGRQRIRDTLLQWEALGYGLLSVLMLVLVFLPPFHPKSSHFYFLFPPLVWAAARHGFIGAICAATLMQVGVIIGAEWGRSGVHSVVEFQLLDAALALVGFFLGMVVDELRRAEEDMKRSLRLAAAGDMATALAHELNQPITAIAAYGKACVYLLDNGQTGELLQDTIRRLAAESTRAAEVVRRLKEFFRAGTLKLEIVEVGDMLKEAIQSFEEKLAAQGIKMVLDVPEAAIAQLDRMQIGFVLRNLIANASDAIALQQGVSGLIEVTARVLAGGRLRVTVRDNGPGVSASIAGKLFEPFVSSKSSGLGLGLVISKAIVETHGGKLWAEIGTQGVFTFELPFTEKAAHVAA
ncbi:MAG: ATP-binding protein [Rhodocyclaceae bacterium]